MIDFNETNVTNVKNMLQYASVNVERVFLSGKRVGYKEGFVASIEHEFGAELDAIIAIQEALIEGGF